MRIPAFWRDSSLWGALILALPFGWMWTQVSTHAANPVEYLLRFSGETTARLLIFTLLLTPFRVMWPKARWVIRLNQHRRLIGVSVFVYALVHLTFYVLDVGELETLIKNLGKPFVWSGMIAFVCLFLLAATSSNWAIRQLGGKRWKALHRLVYLAALAAFWHIWLKEKRDLLETLVLFVPFVVAEAYRVSHWWLRRKLRQLRVSGSA